MAEIASGKLKINQGRDVHSGWIMTSKRGVSYHKSDLSHEASERLIPLGKEAVPELLRWLSHDEGSVRYVAAFSLREITGVDPPFYYFGTRGEPINGDPQWFNKSVAAWREWYNSQRKAQ